MSYRLILPGFALALLLNAPSAFASYKQHLVLPLNSQESSEKSASSISNVQADEEGDSMEQTDTDVDVLAGFGPEHTLTRSQFTALIVEKLYTQTEIDRCYWDITSAFPPDFTLVFTDVHVNDRFAKHICVAMRDSLIRGYSDGSFRPDRIINFAESAKILSRALALAPYAQVNNLSPWYREYTESLARRGIIPTSITRMDQLVTAAEANEMLMRAVNNITWLPSRSYEELQPKPIRQTNVSAPKKTGSTSSTPAKTSASKSSAKSKAVSSIMSSIATSSRRTIWNPF
jgi:hypothetical protein